MKYKLLATDMDGTALTKDKRLSPRTVAAMQKATDQGKFIVFTTGRSISLIKPYMDAVKGMRYAITASGGTVIDTQTGNYLVHRKIDIETVKRIIAAASGSYAYPILFYDNATFGSSWCVDRLEDFGLPAYAPIYRSFMNLVDDSMSYFMEHPAELEKFNLFFGNDYEADEVYERIKELPVRFTSRTKTSLEINAPGVSKAEGLRVLCSHLGIDISETIAVGDAENDEELLTAAGLNVAVANGTEKVRALADIITDDNENDGVAKIIEQYLLD
ncbi:MAG: HAD family hydrolase [Oscillospiraceae bacterium]|nr:HAD family hydrolase [Oscillospiraceae bacterium]